MGFAISSTCGADEAVTNRVKQPIRKDAATSAITIPENTECTTFTWYVVRTATEHYLPAANPAKPDIQFPSTSAGPTTTAAATAANGRTTCKTECLAGIWRGTGYVRQCGRPTYSSTAYGTRHFRQFGWSRLGPTSRQSNRHESVFPPTIHGCAGRCQLRPDQQEDNGAYGQSNNNPFGARPGGQQNSLIDL